MKELIAILESRRANCSRGIQKALRQIDTRVLAGVLNRLDKKYHEIFFGNMTKMAGDIVRQEMNIQKEFTDDAYDSEHASPEEQIKTLCSVLMVYTNENFDKLYEYPAYSQSVKFGSVSETADTFYSLALFAHQNGLMSLDGIQEKCGNRLFAKSLDLLLMGIEQFRFEELLENYKNQYLKNVETIYTMIIKGIKSLYDGDHPEMVKEKLDSIAEA